MLNFPADRVTIELWSNLDQPANDESWGFRDLQIQAYNSCPGDCTLCGENACLSCEEDSVDCQERTFGTIEDITDSTGVSGWHDRNADQISSFTCEGVTMLGGYSS
mmetsp:Transcript_37020/g.33288  ORF Transcript_37020/g.33288 Transcript_37020/m.33288 type:complete len:106 (-) Transcript_37020:45-362(-)